MSRYFFDLLNGHGLIRDDMGTEMRGGRDALLREVSRILTDLAREELAEGIHGGIKVTVRDENGQEILLGALDFHTEWHDIQ